MKLTKKENIRIIKELLSKHKDYTVETDDESIILSYKDITVCKWYLVVKDCYACLLVDLKDHLDNIELSKEFKV